MRSRSSYHPGASAARARRLMRTTSAARGPVRDQRVERVVVDRRQLAVAATSAASVAGCPATGRRTCRARRRAPPAPRPRAPAWTPAAGARAGEPGRAEELGQPVDGEEGDAGDAVAAVGHPPEGAAARAAAVRPRRRSWWAPPPSPARAHRPPSPPPPRANSARAAASGPYGTGHELDGIAPDRTADVCPPAAIVALMLRSHHTGVTRMGYEGVRFLARAAVTISSAQGSNSIAVESSTRW